MKKVFKFKVLIFFLIYSCSHTKELTFEQAYFNQDDLEISGLVLKDKSLLFVADKYDNSYIYQANLKENEFTYSKRINLQDLKGFNAYIEKTKKGINVAHSSFSHLDLEGIARCNNTYYVVNEQVRHVLKIEKGTMSYLPIDFQNIYKKNNLNLVDIPQNAGFEGIAIDCERSMLYVAQERSPRAIIKINLKNMKASRFFKTTPPIPLNISLNYADLYYESNYLYLLERNSRFITKYDVVNEKIVSSYSFEKLGKFKELKQLYNTGKPYGLAEGLAMDQSYIYISLDNNKSPLSKEAHKYFGIKGTKSVILKFKRPKDF